MFLKFTWSTYWTTWSNFESICLIKPWGYFLTNIWAASRNLMSFLLPLFPSSCLSFFPFFFLSFFFSFFLTDFFYFTSLFLFAIYFPTGLCGLFTTQNFERSLTESSKLISGCPDFRFVDSYKNPLLSFLKWFEWFPDTLPLFTLQRSSLHWSL